MKRFARAVLVLLALFAYFHLMFTVVGFANDTLPSWLIMPVTLVACSMTVWASVVTIAWFVRGLSAQSQGCVKDMFIISKGEE